MSIESIAAKCQRMLKPLPCYVLNRKPLIIISYWHDFLNARIFFLKRLGNYKSAHLLFQLGWHRETDERVQGIKAEIDKLNTEHTGLNFTFLCNSTTEEELFKKYSLHSIFCHQNAFLDENRYRIIKDVQKKYDAIYIARITPFKRHELASSIKSLHLIGDYFEREQDHYKKIMHILNQTSWVRKVSASKIYKEINSARVGLCLSAEEGAMFVSAEYFLCGIPVVNTDNIGGRDFLFPDNCFAQVNPTPQDVTAGVKRMAQSKINPESIRTAIISKMQQHRKPLITLLQEIVDKNNVDYNIKDNWKRIFIHKLGLRSGVPIWIRITRSF
ncbi:MAG: glycosyltransferase [Lentisphaerae bacterium]|nr:glycosyltransferase [Lentisphaerota bacterium]MCP4103604.1 glycosyltransferase [Lentisphaerota bacterium]